MRTIKKVDLSYWDDYARIDTDDKIILVKHEFLVQVLLNEEKKQTQTQERIQ